MRKSAILVVMTTLLGGAVSSAATLPAIGPMTAVDVPLPGRAAYGGPSALSTVWNGKELFSVWSDRRDPHQNNVFGVHVRSGSGVVDKTSVLITPGLNPVVASDGTNFLLVYAENATGASTDLVARRLGPDGNLLDSQKVVLSNAVQAPYQAFWTGSEYAVFWDDSPPDSPQQGYMARIDRNGSLIASRLPIWSSGALVNAASLSMGVAWSGSSFLIAKPSSGPMVQLISSDGKQVGKPFLLTSTTKSTSEPTVASDGTNFLVVWDDNDRGSGVKGIRVSPAGQIVDSSPLVLSNINRAAEAHLIWAGTEYVLDFLGSASGTVATQLLRISSTGIPLDSKPVVTSVYQQQTTRVAATSDRLMLIDPGAGAPVGNWLKLDGTTSSEPAIPLCAAANRQTWPSVASNGVVYLAVWYDERTINSPQVRGQILDVTGKPVLPDSFLVTQATDLATEPYEVDGAGGRLAVASDGKDFLVAWTQIELNDPHSVVRATRISRAGEVLDPTGITIATGHGEMNPVVVWTGASYFVVYLMDIGDSNSNTVVGGRRLDGKGNILDSQDLRLGSGDENADLAIRFAAVWGQDLLVITQGSGQALAAIRFDATGKQLSKGYFSLQRPDIATQIHPSVAWNGKEYVAAWSQYSFGVQDPDLVAARLGPDGSFLDSSFLKVSKAGGMHDGASVAWDGNNFVTAWFSRSNPIGSDDRWSASVARIDASGNVLDPGGLPISNTDEYGARPTVVGLGGGDGLLALQRYDSAADVRAIRVVARAFSDKAPVSLGAPCVDGTACQSGFCSDGVCCTSACGGGIPGDCQACSLAAGAKVDGTCGVLAAGAICRASIGQCDRPELCDGINLVCPEDRSIDGGCGTPEPAPDAGIVDSAVVRDTAVADSPVAPNPDTTVVDASFGPETPTVETPRDAAVALEAIPDLSPDKPENRALPDALVATDLALVVDAKAPTPAIPSGCGCRLGGAPHPGHAAVALFMVTALLAPRLRRRKR